MSEEQYELFNEIAPLVINGLLYASLGSRQLLVTVRNRGLFVKDARALRDWLDKALPDQLNDGDHESFVRHIHADPNLRVERSQSRITLKALMRVHWHWWTKYGGWRSWLYWRRPGCLRLAGFTWIW